MEALVKYNSGFRVQRFRVQRFRVQRFRVQGSGFKVQGSKVQGSKVQGSGFKVQGSAPPPATAARLIEKETLKKRISNNECRISKERH